MADRTVSSVMPSCSMTRFHHPLAQLAKCGRVLSRASRRHTPREANGQGDSQQLSAISHDRHVLSFPGMAALVVECCCINAPLERLMVAAALVRWFSMCGHAFVAAFISADICFERRNAATRKRRRS